MSIKAKQIDALVGRPFWSSTIAAPSSGTTLTVTTLLSGKTSGGTDTQAGVFTTAPNNKVYVRKVSDGKAVTSNGAQVFGRLTYATGVWTVTFYTMSGGSETAFDWTGNADAGADMSLRFVEVVQLANKLPSDEVEAGESIDEMQASSPLLHQHPAPDILTVSSNGQTALTLAATPKWGTAVELEINGVSYLNGAGKDFTVSGTTLTWLNRQFTLATTDEVVAYYEV